MGKILKTKEGEELYERISRWITIQHDYNITKRHSLYYYADDCCDGSNAVSYFKFNGRKYAIAQMYRLMGMMGIGHNLILNDDSILCAYDGEQYYNPIYIEVDDFGEKVRVYQYVGKEC